MVELIKECRAGLVTNFSLFNILALYSLIQYTSSNICIYFYSYPGDFQFLYWDVFGNFFFFIVFGYTQTADKLSKEKPSRSLLTVTNLLQVFIMFIIQLAGQVLMIFSLAKLFPV
jgi:cation-transporting ATPase 13A2